MKHFGSVIQYSSQRNLEIVRIVRSCFAEVRHITPEVYERAASLPASRFWVSEERALIVIHAMIAGRPIPRMRPNKQEMFREILRRFLILKEKFPSRPDYDLISEVIHQPAPRLYLSPGTIRIFYLRSIKNKSK